jgi:hypothetical protein
MYGVNVFATKRREPEDNSEDIKDSTPDLQPKPSTASDQNTHIPVNDYYHNMDNKEDLKVWSDFFNGEKSYQDVDSEIKRPTFKPCSASGMAFPTITSSIRVLSKFGICAIIYSMVSAANSSGLLKRNKPFGAFPTAVR